MLTPVSRTTFCFMTFVVMILVLSAPTFATDGRTAVGMCIDSTAAGSRCEWSVNDSGEIDICNKNGCIYCASATSDCTVADASRPRPTTGLPAGSEVITAIGKFKVKPHAHPGPLLETPPKKGEAAADKQ